MQIPGRAPDSRPSGCAGRHGGIPGSVTGAGSVLSLEPAAESVQAGEEDALGDIGLVELVADLPLQLAGNDDPPGQTGVVAQPGVQGGGGAGHHGEEGELVDDALIERGRLEEGDEGLI